MNNKLKKCLDNYLSSIESLNEVVNKIKDNYTFLNDLSELLLEKDSLAIYSFSTDIIIEGGIEQLKRFNKFKEKYEHTFIENLIFPILTWDNKKLVQYQKKYKFYPNGKDKKSDDVYFKFNYPLDKFPKELLPDKECKFVEKTETKTNISLECPVK